MGQPLAEPDRVLAGAAADLQQPVMAGHRGAEHFEDWFAVLIAGFGVGFHRDSL